MRTEEFMNASLENVRADFPILKQLVNGKPLIYFDNAATTQKPRLVIDAVSRYYSETLIYDDAKNFTLVNE